MTEALQVGQFCCLSSHDLHTERAPFLRSSSQLQKTAQDVVTDSIHCQDAAKGRKDLRACKLRLRKRDAHLRQCMWNTWEQCSFLLRPPAIISSRQMMQMPSQRAKSCSSYYSDSEAAQSAWCTAGSEVPCTGTLEYMHSTGHALSPASAMAGEGQCAPPLWRC